MMQSGGQAAGQLSVGAPGSPPAAPLPTIDQPTTGDRFQAVINCHACNLHQIEVAIEANQHTTDPHPAQPGRTVARHPVILACFDYASLDDQGRPAEGQPAELNMTVIRQIFSTRYAHVSADPPPADGSHISVEGMHVIAELDQAGNATGRVRFGNPDEVK
jgi:hypothetical protein